MVRPLAVGAWEQFSSTNKKAALECLALVALCRFVSLSPELEWCLPADPRQDTRSGINTGLAFRRRRSISILSMGSFWFPACPTSFQASRVSRVLAAAVWVVVTHGLRQVTAGGIGSLSIFKRPVMVLAPLTRCALRQYRIDFCYA